MRDRDLFGERVDVYEREDGSLGFLEDYARDENTRDLLRRLSDTAARFREAFETQAEFDAFFPKITPMTRLSEARKAEPWRRLDVVDDATRAADPASRQRGPSSLYQLGLGR